MLNDVPSFGDSSISVLGVVLQSQFHVSLDDSVHVGLHEVGPHAAADLHEEDDAEQHGKGQGHAVVLLNGAAASEEGHPEDEESDDDQQNRRVEEPRAEKVQILAVDALNDDAGDDQNQAGNLSGDKNRR